jgi:hypothetical protein
MLCEVKMAVDDIIEALKKVGFKAAGHKTENAINLGKIITLANDGKYDVLKGVETLAKAGYRFEFNETKQNTGCSKEDYFALMDFSENPEKISSVVELLKEKLSYRGAINYNQVSLIKNISELKGDVENAIDILGKMKYFIGSEGATTVFLLEQKDVDVIKEYALRFNKKELSSPQIEEKRKPIKYCGRG